MHVYSTDINLLDVPLDYGENNVFNVTDLILCDVNTFDIVKTNSF